MVRPLGFLVGLGFITALVLAIFTTPLSNEPNVAYSFVKHPRHVKLASDGLVPHWDKAQLQRGMQVYKEVCSACHSLNLVAFRNIQDLGYTEGQVKTFAKGFQVPSINPDTGEVATRDGLSSDHFPAPYRQRSRGARGEQQRDAARSVADHQGARRRQGLCLFAADRLSEPAGEPARGAEAGNRAALQPLFPEPEPRDGQAAERTVR